MFRALSKFFSAVFHPLMMPTFVVIILLNSTSFLAYTTGETLKNFLYGIVFITTYVIPVVGVLLLWKNGFISSLEIPERKERYLPFILTTLCYFGTIYLLLKLPVPKIFALMIVGGLVATITAFIITLKWKISVHMIGIGGALGLIVGYTQLFPTNMTHILMLIALVAGILGSSRLTLDAHTKSQVYVGFLVGFFVEIIYLAFIVKPYFLGIA